MGRGEDGMGRVMGRAAQLDRSTANTVFRTEANGRVLWVSHSLREGLQCPCSYCCCRPSVLWSVYNVYVYRNTKLHPRNTQKSSGRGNYGSS